MSRVRINPMVFDNSGATASAMISMEATRASAQAIVGVPGGAELLLACIFFWVNDWLLEAILSSSRISSVGELIWWLFLASVYVLSWIGGVASIFSKRMFPLVLLIASILAVKGFGGIYDAGYVITSSGLISFVGACAASFFLWTVYLGIGLGLVSPSGEWQPDNVVGSGDDTLLSIMGWCSQKKGTTGMVLGGLLTCVIIWVLFLAPVIKLLIGTGVLPESLGVLAIVMDIPDRFIYWFF